ncbi:Uncharacterised protein [Bordetella pertussis]|nr:Uncharacterised protein [Bordetella pertussis]
MRNWPSALELVVSTAHSPLANNWSLLLSSEYAVNSSERFQLTISETWRMYSVSNCMDGEPFLATSRPLFRVAYNWLLTGARFSRCTVTWSLVAYGQSMLATSRSLSSSACRSAQVRAGLLGSRPAFL